MRTIVSAKGEITIPAEYRILDKIQPGQEFDLVRLGTGQYRLVRRAVATNQGLVDWLLACPEKGFFQPIRSGSTDTL